MYYYCHVSIKTTLTKDFVLKPIWLLAQTNEVHCSNWTQLSCHDDHHLTLTSPMKYCSHNHSLTQSVTATHTLHSLDYSIKIHSWHYYQINFDSSTKKKNSLINSLDKNSPIHFILSTFFFKHMKCVTHYQENCL